jgi:uncharacterized protein (DUF1778 family)
MNVPEDWKRLKPERIVLLPGDFNAFIRQIDDPRPPTKELIELLRRKAPWEK